MSAKKLPIDPKILIGIVAVLIVGVGAFFLFGKGGMKDSSTNSSSAFTSIKDALSKSLSLECDFTDTDGRLSKVYIKNGAMRGDFTGATADESGSMIVKDKKMYFWNENEGYVMAMPDEEGMDYDDSSMQANEGSDFLKEIEQYKDNCKPAVVSDSLFTPPSDVAFTDMSKMMDSMQGVPQGSQMTEEEIQKMMQQYSDQ